MSFDFSTLITDRTQADVNRVGQIAAKIKTGTASASELAEFNSAAMKGAYNHTDLNRVTAAMEALKAKLEGYGYSVPGYQRIEIPHSSSGGGEEYIKLEYIESSGTQYIDTGFVPNQDTRVYAECVLAISSSSTNALFGCRVSSSSRQYQFVTQGGYYRTDYNTTVANFASNDYGTEKFYVDKNKNVTDLNGDTTYTHGYAAFTCPGNMYIFATNNNGALYANASAKLYCMKIYDNGTLARDFVPCINGSGEAGLYDLVGKKFYGNAGSGSFIAGGSNQGVLPVGYTELEYIESSGTQYIDTGVVPKANPQVNMVATLLNDDNREMFGTAIRETPCWILNLEDGVIYYRYYINSSVTATYVVGNIVGNKLEYNIGQTLAIGGVTYCTAAAADFSAFAQTLRLFAAREPTDESYNASMQLYSCQMYDNDTLVRDFVPCINPNGECGLYDIVNKQFYGNAGTGTFETGNIIPAPAIAPDPYTWYEYDWPTPEAMTVYLLNVSAIRAALSVLQSTPSVPPDMEALMVQEANNIEKILVDIDQLLINAEKAWFYSGDLFSGEV